MKTTDHGQRDLTHLWQFALQNAKTSLARFRKMLFGASTESKDKLLERPARWETAEADHQRPAQTGSSRTDFVGHRQPPTQNGLMDLSWAMAAY